MLRVRRLGDGLETVYSNANCIGLVNRNRSTDDLGDEGVSGSCDPDVSSLIDCERRGTWVYYWLIPGALPRLAGLLADST